MVVYVILLDIICKYLFTLLCASISLPPIFYYINTYTPKHSFIYAHPLNLKYANAHLQNTHIHTHTHTRAYKYTRTHTHTRTHIHIYTYTHAPIYTHTLFLV